MSWQLKAAHPPPDYAYGPAYRPSWANILRASLYIALGRPRSLARDTLLAIRNMPRPPLVRGSNYIPTSGPFVVVANHYERPGLWMAWPATFASHLVWERAGQDVRWLAITEWESFSLWGIPIPPTWTRALFARAFAAYGILPMAPPSAAASARASSMRAAVGILKGGGIIGLMPEGDVGPTPELLPAREGVGAFLLLLAHGNVPMLPVGFYEEHGRLVAQAGPPFALAAPRDLPRDERDRWARDRVMHAIRALLPPALWGQYSEET